MALRGFGSVPSSEEVDNVEADAAGAAGSRRTGMDGGSSGIHRVAAGWWAAEHSSPKKVLVVVGGYKSQESLRMNEWTAARATKREKS